MGATAAGTLFVPRRSMVYRTAMAQKKAHEVDRWLARPDAGVATVLVYGPDRGLVSERARRFAASTGLPLDDPFSVVRLDAGTLGGDPGRLVDEARTVAMFASRRLIWVLDAGAEKGLADAVRVLTAEPPSDALVLIEAGDLKKGAALRAVVEEASSAMALPCYADDGRSIERLIDDVLGAAGLGIAIEARELLRGVLGGDRLASRAELDKLALYCMGAGTVQVDDVRAAIGDVAGVAVDAAIDAAIEGRGAELDRSLARLESAGIQPFLVLAAAQRQFQAFQIMRDAMDREGKSASAAVASARPPVFFSRRDAVTAALAAFDAATIAQMLERIRDTVLETRRRPELARAATHEAMMAIAVRRARARR